MWIETMNKTKCCVCGAIDNNDIIYRTFLIIISMTSRSKKYFDVKNMSKNIKRFRKGIPNSDVFALCNRIKYDLVKISAERTRKDYFVDLSDLGIKKLGQ